MTKAPLDSVGPSPSCRSHHCMPLGAVCSSQPTSVLAARGGAAAAAAGAAASSPRPHRAAATSTVLLSAARLLLVLQAASEGTGAAWHLHAAMAPRLQRGSAAARCGACSLGRAGLATHVPGALVPRHPCCAACALPSIFAASSSGVFKGCTGGSRGHNKCSAAAEQTQQIN